MEDSKREIQYLEEKVSENLGSEIGSIFGTHRMVLQDARLKNEVIEKIRKTNFTPEFAVSLGFACLHQKIPGCE
ncbi:MAG: phosphoenolpyruvate-utilizing N-terminal domain-containing protein [Candidatus Brocadiaceae baterium WH-1]|nr:MAG: phosphoenolpyruvate-utilizing N-terminal domain-containing protein [Candidatus Jettenia sp. AMX2]